MESLNFTTDVMYTVNTSKSMKLEYKACSIYLGNRNRPAMTNSMKGMKTDMIPLNGAMIGKRSNRSWNTLKYINLFVAVYTKRRMNASLMNNKLV
jgi:hypothetical protein